MPTRIPTMTTSLRYFEVKYDLILDRFIPSKITSKEAYILAGTQSDIAYGLLRIALSPVKILEHYAEISPSATPFTH